MHFTSLLLVALALVFSTVTAQSSASPTCVQGATVTGTGCVAECGFDRPGGDYDRKQVASYQACAQLCSKAPKCITAQYQKSSRFCYLKNSLKKQAASTAVDGVVCKPSKVIPCQNDPGHSICRDNSQCTLPQKCFTEADDRICFSACDAGLCGGGASYYYPEQRCTLQQACCPEDPRSQIPLKKYRRGLTSFMSNERPL